MAKKKDYTRREVIGTLAAAALATSAVGALPIEVSAEGVSQAQTGTWPVVRYSVGWNTRTRVGRIALYLQNPTNPTNPALNPNPNPAYINIASLSDLPGYMAILKEEPVHYNSGGWLHTGREEIN